MSFTTIFVIFPGSDLMGAGMRHVYWAKSQSQHLLPTALTLPPSASRTADWHLGVAILACAVIFVVDVAIPGVVVGLLYCLVVLGLARARRIGWLAAVCALGTLFHAVAGIYELPAAELPVVIANRSLAILVLWVVGGWIAFNLAGLGARVPAYWRAVTGD
jgi:hypothetical protein